MLQYILKHFVDLEQSDGIAIEMPNYEATQLIKYIFKFMILFTIGDVVGHDKLCNRFANYRKN